THSLQRAAQLQRQQRIGGRCDVQRAKGKLRNAAQAKPAGGQQRGGAARPASALARRLLGCAVLVSWPVGDSNAMDN
ncbi:MAG: hypothetical protein WAT33_04290, partial [Giesbergeria sp.]